MQERKYKFACAHKCIIHNEFNKHSLPECSAFLVYDIASTISYFKVILKF